MFTFIASINGSPGLRQAAIAKPVKRGSGECCRPAPPDIGRSRRRRSVCCGAAFLAISLMAIASAEAQVVFDVNDSGDDIDANVLDGKCETPLPVKTCTLRAAVMQANRIPSIRVEER